MAPGNPNTRLPAPSGAGTGSNAHIKSIINIDYYNERLHFCKPKDGPKAKSEGLGSVLFGDRIYDSPIVPRMAENEQCVQVCQTEIPAQDAAFINEKIEQQYAVNWMVDGLPVATKKIADRTQEIFYAIGFPLGQLYDEANLALTPPALNNHHDIYIEYHKRGPNEFRVVGARVYPRSTDSLAGGKVDCKATKLLQLRTGGASQQIAYTYSTYWEESPTPWATRWDNYLRVFDPRIHWFALINSIIIVAFLILMVGVILMRSVSRDISRYNAIDLDEDVQEEYGWKLVHADVNRTPPRAMMLATMIGTGTQLVAMAMVTLLFALLGLLSPSNRGSLGTVMVVTWCLFGSVAGYFSARIYISLGGQQWKQTAGMTAILFPAVIFTAILSINFFLLVSNSSGAVPFGTLLALIFLWFCINVPLVLAGSVVGIRVGGWQNPTKVNTIPRQIPPQVWYLRPYTSAIMAGILPFGAAFLELFFVMNSLFGTKVYYAFGFLALTFIVTALTTATVTVLYVYFALCAEDYRWQWRAFLTGGGSSFWLFLYGLFYWMTRLDLDGFSNRILYLGYLCTLSLLNFLLFGTIGWLSSFAAIRSMYQSVRVD
jgi:transmembrane 9 superfamily protein 2/4